MHNFKQISRGSMPRNKTHGLRGMQIYKSKKDLAPLRGQFLITHCSV